VLKLSLHKLIAQVEIWGEGVWAAMPHKLTHSGFWHPFLHELGDPGMPEEMSVHLGKMTPPGVVTDHLLDGIHCERATTSFPFESKEDVVHVREEAPPLFIEVAVQCSEGGRVHEHCPCIIAFRCGDTDATPTALDVLEPDGHCFADSETADPHQQHQGAIAPTGKHAKESAQIVVRQDARHPLRLFPVQALTVLPRSSQTLTRADRVPGKVSWVK
jgi:hypothetical protein